MDHLFDCMENPYQLDTKLHQNCLGQFGGPIQPYLVLGDFQQANHFETAQGLLISLLVVNKLNDGRHGPKYG
jgi:hypothetical protein